MATTVEIIEAPKKVENPHFLRRVILGGIAGIIGATSVFPIDVVKTRLQSQRPLPDGTLPYKGVGDAFAKLYRGNNGFLGMYNGLVAQLVGITPEKAIKLAANDMFRFYLPKNAQGELDLIYEVVAGAGAGITQVVATNPMEIVKIRMQVTKRAASEVLKELGLAGLYKGTSATLLRDIPFSMVFFPLFARTKKHFTDAQGNVPIEKLFVAGSFAGFVGATLSTPFDVMKTRMQMKDSPYKNVYDCFVQTWKEGPKNFWRGVGPRMLIISPLFGITMFTYETLQKFAHKYLD